MGEKIVIQGADTDRIAAVLDPNASEEVIERKMLDAVVSLHRLGEGAEGIDVVVIPEVGEG